MSLRRSDSQREELGFGAGRFGDEAEFRGRQRPGLATRQSAAPPPRVAPCSSSVQPWSSTLRSSSRSQSRDTERRVASRSQSRDSSRGMAARSRSQSLDSSRGMAPRSRSQSLDSSKGRDRTGLQAVATAMSALLREPPGRAGRGGARKASVTQASTGGEVNKRSVAGSRGSSLSRPSSMPRPLERMDINLGLAEEPGLQGAAEIARLRTALALTNKHVEEAVDEVASMQLRLQDNKVHQEMEAIHLREVFEILKTENKKLQAAARNGWSAAWRLQASLRAHEEEVTLQSAEVSEKQRGLEKENIRLRKESSAVKTRLLGWQQTQKRSAPRPQPTTAVAPLLQTATCGTRRERLQLHKAKLPAQFTSTNHNSALYEAFLARSPTQGSVSSVCSLQEGSTSSRDPARSQSLPPNQCQCSGGPGGQTEIDGDEHPITWGLNARLSAAGGQSGEAPPRATLSALQSGPADLLQRQEEGAEEVSWALPAEPMQSGPSSPASSSCVSSHDGAVSRPPPPPFLQATPDGRRPGRRSRSQDVCRQLSPAAREAADVSARVRQRAAEALRGLGLRGELRPSSSASSPRTSAPAPESVSSHCKVTSAEDELGNSLGAVLRAVL